MTSTMGQPANNKKTDESEAEDRPANDKADEVKVNNGPGSNDARDGECCNKKSERVWG